MLTKGIVLMINCLNDAAKHQMTDINNKHWQTVDGVSVIYNNQVLGNETDISWLLGEQSNCCPSVMEKISFLTSRDECMGS